VPCVSSHVGLSFGLLPATGDPRSRRTGTTEWQLRIERARCEADLARRRFFAVDPENRLVARSLERGWNEKPAEIERLEREYATSPRPTALLISPRERQRILALAQGLPPPPLSTVFANWPPPTRIARSRLFLTSKVSLPVRANPSPMLKYGGSVVLTTFPLVVQRLPLLVPTVGEGTDAIQPRLQPSCSTSASPPSAVGASPVVWTVFRQSPAAPGGSS
jgi:hypothetical protein